MSENFEKNEPSSPPTCCKKEAKIIPDSIEKTLEKTLKRSEEDSLQTNPYPFQNPVKKSLFTRNSQNQKILDLNMRKGSKQENEARV